MLRLSADSTSTIRKARNNFMDTQLYFGLNQMPFQKSSQYSSLYKGKDVRQIENRLEHLRKTRGIGMITGKPGAGKTAVIREFARSLNPTMYKVIYIQMTTVSVNEFLKMIALELGLDPKYKKADLFHQIQEEVRYQCEEKKCIPVLIIDEAQYLSQAILRDLVMLLNFDMDSKDCCIMILSGLSSLNRIMKKTSNEALRQRIIVNYQAEGLNRQEAGEYVQWCLKQSGAEETIFSEDAIEAAWRDSQGSLRRMNTLLSRGMIAAAGQDKRIIDSEVISIARMDADME